MSSTVARLGLSAAAVVLALAAGVPPAAADAPILQGWWSAAGPANAAMAADVPSDGLLVQGGASADTPNAYAGLAFTLATGLTPGSLTLKLASGGNSVPGSTVKVCRLAGPFAPAQGGDASTGPRFDCANAPTGVVSGDQVTVDLSSFTGSNAIDIAVVPASPTDRVVFAKPDSSTLTTTSAASSSGDAGTSSAPVGDTSSASSVDTGASYTAPSAAVDAPALAAPDVPITPSTPATPTSAERSAQLDAAPASRSTSTGGAHGWVVMLFLGCVAAAAVLWLGAGAGEPRELPAD